MHKFKTFRSKFVFITVLLIFLLQLLYIILYSQNFNRISKHIDEEFINIQVNFIKHQFTTTYEYINTLGALLSTESFAEYSINNWGLRMQSDAEIMKEKLNSSISDLQIDSDIIESVYYIGRNSNQKNFMKNILTGEVMSDSLPDIDMLRKTDLITMIGQDKSRLIYFEPGELVEKIEKSVDGINEEESIKLKEFCSKLENRTVYIQYTTNWKGNYLFLMTLNQDMYQNMFQTTVNPSEVISVFDKNNTLRWSSYNWSTYEMEGIKEHLVKNNDEYSSWNQYESKNGLIHYIDNQKAEGLKLVYSYKQEQMSSTNNKLLHQFIIVSPVLIIISGVIVYILSGIVTIPLKQVAEKLAEFAALDTLSKIPFVPSLGKRLIATSTKMKIQVVMCITILIPSILSGIIYINFITNNYRVRYETIISTFSMKIAEEISATMRSYYTAKGMIPITLLEEKLYERVGFTQLNSKIDEVVVNQSMGINGFTYFVLLNSSGSALYQSSYPDDKEIFEINSKKIIGDFKNESKDSFWYTINNPLFNKPMITLVRKIYKSTVESQDEIQGYLMMYLNSNVFDCVKTSSYMNFIILDPQDGMLYDSSVNYNQNQLINTTMEERIQSKAAIPNTNCMVYVYRETADIKLIMDKMTFYGMFIDLIIVGISLIMASILATLLVKPIEKMKKNIMDQNSGEDYKTIKYYYKDEVGQLIFSYNNMIDSINQLMKEKTEQKLKEQELETLKTKAELNMLQQQINPHFLYNALELINIQAIKLGDDTISKMSQTLASLFRFNISNLSDTVTLEREIEQAKAYATIMEMRFRGKLEFHWNVDEKAMSFNILKLIIQPLIENAIKHGLYPLNAKGSVTVSVHIKQELLYITVEDNGIGIDPEDLALLRNSIESDLRNKDSVK